MCYDVNTFTKYNYSRSQLIAFRRPKQALSSSLISLMKSEHIFTYNVSKPTRRGKRSGKQKQLNKIKPIIEYRPEDSHHEIQHTPLSTLTNKAHFSDQQFSTQISSFSNSIDAPPLLVPLQLTPPTDQEIRHVKVIINNRLNYGKQPLHGPKAKSICINNLQPVSIVKATPTTNQSNLVLATQNTQSVRNKTILMNDIVVEKNIDLIVITESWLKENEDNIINEIVPNGYSFVNQRRLNGQSGGGIIIIHKTGLKVKKIDSGYDFKHFEYIETMVTHSNVTYRVIGLYRPQPTVKNGNSFVGFMGEFETFLIDKTTESGKLILLGDLNFHLNDDKDREARLFMNLLDSLNLKQHVKEPTHIKGNTLDIAIDIKENSSISSITVTDCIVSDHFLVSVNIPDTKPLPEKKSVTYKKTKNIDFNIFKEELRSELSQTILSTDSLLEKVNNYNLILKTIFDKHAPDQTRTITIRPNNGSWYTDAIRNMKKQVRKFEKVWRKTKRNNNYKKRGQNKEENSCKENEHLQQYREARKQLNVMIKTAKHENLKISIEENRTNTKNLFKIVNNLTSSDSHGTKLPDYDDASQLASDFNRYFNNKITTIRKTLDQDQPTTDPKSTPTENTTRRESTLDEWTPTTLEDVTDIIRKLPAKTCSLDPIPTWVLKECCTEIAPVILDIVNSSLNSGVVPCCLKKAIVRPLIKKTNLDKNNFKNFRPVSNLCTLSKIIEKIVCSKLNRYLDVNQFRSKVQSAYRVGHSTESALIRVHSDIVNLVGKGNTAILVLLDLSAAFDTIDQRLLLNRLRCDFGIKDKVLAWFESYLLDRSQCVSINDCTSECSVLRFGVPQGSVLGPLLYTLYTTPISNIISSYNLDNHLFADDTQIYFPVTEETSTEIISRVETCMYDISVWMKVNKLKLNEDKTEIISFYGNNRNVTNIASIDIAGKEITVLNEGNVRNLGVFLDSKLCMNDHANKIIQVCQFYMQKIFRIRHLLDNETTKILMSSFVLSRLDYCNAILKSSPAYVINRLQKVQNRAARLVTECRTRDHITPVLENLHWLPVQSRIDFKVLCYAFKCFYKTAPIYLQEIVQIYEPKRSLRSNDKDLFTIPFTKSSICDRAFSKSAPVLWNALPIYIKRSDNINIFKKRLKTHLFQKHFNNF